MILRLPNPLPPPAMTAERWGQLPFMEQMANISSEVGRTIQRKKKDFLTKWPWFVHWIYFS
jgi:hypothetical protein